VITRRSNLTVGPPFRKFGALLSRDSWRSPISSNLERGIPRFSSDQQGPDESQRRPPARCPLLPGKPKPTPGPPHPLEAVPRPTRRDLCNVSAGSPTGHLHDSRRVQELWANPPALCHLTKGWSPIYNPCPGAAACRSLRHLPVAASNDPVPPATGACGQLTAPFPLTVPSHPEPLRHSGHILVARPERLITSPPCPGGQRPTERLQPWQSMAVSKRRDDAFELADTACRVIRGLLGARDGAYSAGRAP